MGRVTKPSLTRGSLQVGNSSAQAAEVAAKSDGYILVGDGTDLNSVAVSGDVTLANTGAVTVAANAIETGMLHKSLVRVSTVDIAAASVKTLDATPVVCVDHSALVASGDIATGDVLIFEGAVLQINGGTTNYDQNENLTFNYQTAGGGATVSTTVANFFNGGAADKMSTAKPITTDVTPEADQDIVVKCSASPFSAAGDRLCRVTVWWRAFTPA